MSKKMRIGVAGENLEAGSALEFRDDGKLYMVRPPEKKRLAEIIKEWSKKGTAYTESGINLNKDPICNIGCDRLATAAMSWFLGVVEEVEAEQMAKNCLGDGRHYLREVKARLAEEAS